MIGLKNTFHEKKQPGYLRKKYNTSACNGFRWTQKLPDIFHIGINWKRFYKTLLRLWSHAKVTFNITRANFCFRKQKVGRVKRNECDVSADNVTGSAKKNYVYLARMCMQNLCVPHPFAAVTYQSVYQKRNMNPTEIAWLFKLEFRK